MTGSENSDAGQLKFVRKKDYVYRQIAGNDVLISVGGNIADFNGYIELNPAAACIWKTLEQESTVKDLEKALETEFDVSHETAAEDVREFLQELKEHQMVEVK